MSTNEENSPVIGLMAVECEPDWVPKAGDDLIFNFDGCNGVDDIFPPGDELIFDFNCCTPPVEAVIATGAMTLVLQVEGSVESLNTPTANGSLDLEPVTMQAQATHGVNVQGSLALGQVVASGEATYQPENIIATGAITLNITSSGTAEYYLPRLVDGDISLSVIVDGLAYIIPEATGFNDALGVTIEGAAETTIPTALPSNLILDAVTLTGEATYADVPTWNGSITLTVTAEGVANYIDLPTASGDIALSIIPNGAAIDGFHVYWANLQLNITAEGVAFYPNNATGINNFGEIKVESSAIGCVVGSETAIQIGEIKVNRGWAEFGEMLPPTIREIYEASNVRSSNTKTYPIEAKYPVYVPTTDYNIHEVKQRRGTLEYTLEFNFDAIQVDVVKVWIVDENGNATLDSVAEYKGDSKPHILNQPFIYGLTIPVHCVNDFRYQFMLEVVYYDVMHDGTVLIDRKSMFVPFQAHFDNRIPYANLTDRTTIVNGNFASIGTPALEFNSVSFDPASYAVSDEANIGLSNSEQTPNQFDTYVELSRSKEIYIDIANRVGIKVQPFGVLNTKYFELDVGQIGG